MASELPRSLPRNFSVWELLQLRDPGCRILNESMNPRWLDEETRRAIAKLATNPERINRPCLNDNGLVEPVERENRDSGGTATAERSPAY